MKEEMKEDLTKLNDKDVKDITLDDITNELILKDYENVEKKVDLTPLTKHNLLKEPKATLDDIKAIPTPVDGEARQDLSKLPDIYLYIFNENAGSGESANDGTKGYWNLISSVANPVTKEAYYGQSYSKNKNASVTISPNRDIRVKVQWSISAWTSGKGYVYSVGTIASGTVVQGASSCELYINDQNNDAHCMFSIATGIYDLDAGGSYTFKFGNPSRGLNVDNNDRSTVIVTEIPKYVM